jgi:hypothetical protein
MSSWASPELGRQKVLRRQKSDDHVSDEAGAEGAEYEDEDEWRPPRSPDKGSGDVEEAADDEEVVNDEEAADMNTDDIEQAMPTLDGGSISNVATATPPVTILARRGRATEMTWQDRAMVCFCYHHPLLANKNATLCVSLFHVNINTIKGWATKASMTGKWLNVAKDLVIQDVLDFIRPSGSWQVHPHLADLTAEEKQQGLPESAIDHVNQKPEINKAIFRGAGGSIQKSYVNQEKKRSYRPDRKSIKYRAEHDFIKKELEEHHKRGESLTMPQLLTMMREKFTSGKLFDFCLADMSAYKQRSARQWLRRAVESAGYQIHSSEGEGGSRATISSRARRKDAPEDWKALCIEEAQRIRDNFVKQGVHVVISTDELVLRYTEASSEAAVYSSDEGDSADDNPGSQAHRECCTLLVSMELRTSSLVFPFMICKSTMHLEPGTVAKRLPSTDGNHGVLVLSNSHCQTVETLKLYLGGIRKIYRGKVVGVVVDAALGPLVLEWVQSENKSDKRNTKLVVACVDERAAPFLQASNVTLRDTLKEKLGLQLDRYVKALDFVPPEDTRIPLLREDVIGFVKRATAEIDKEQFTDRYISTGFDICGLNPYLKREKHESYLVAYLDSLDDDRISEMLAEEGDFVDLSDKFAHGIVL